MQTRTLIAVAVTLTLAAMTTSAGPAPNGSAEPIRDSQAWTGTVVEWHVSGRGVVSVQLETQDDEGLPRPRWFRTPGDRSGSTHFEDLLLRIVLGIEDDAPLTIHATRDSSGETLEEALKIEAVSSSRANP